MPSRDGLTTPAPLEEKKVYPPIQWWPLRVMNPSHKTGFLLIYWVAGFGLVRLLSLVAPGQAGGRHSGLELSDLTSMLVGVAFLNSSIRLTINRRRARQAHPQG